MEAGRSWGAVLTRLELRAVEGAGLLLSSSAPLLRCQPVLIKRFLLPKGIRTTCDGDGLVVFSEAKVGVVLNTIFDDVKEGYFSSTILLLKGSLS